MIGSQNYDLIQQHLNFVREEKAKDEKQAVYEYEVSPKVKNFSKNGSA